NPPPPTHTSALSLHDALPISPPPSLRPDVCEALLGKQETASEGGAYKLIETIAIGGKPLLVAASHDGKRVLVLNEEGPALDVIRSEEHTSELQSRFDLVCRLL